MTHRRAYKSGTSWCLWRWTDVDSGYITRLHIIKTPWWAICLHWLNHPDLEPYLHDHPVTFLSIILSGGYGELRKSGYRYREWYNLVRATDRHTIMYVSPHTVTLCFMGPKVQEWGFYKAEGKVYWKDYYAAKRAANVSA